MIPIAIAVLIALAVLVLFTTAKRRDTTLLSRETVKKDKSESPYLPDAAEAPRGREYERQVNLARTSPGTEIALPADTAPVPYVPVDPETLGVSRRQFFNRANTILMSAGLGAFGVAIIGFLWPSAGGGFGSKVNVGKLDDILTQINNGDNFLYLPEARTWMTAYPADALPKARAAYGGQPSVLGGMEAGVVALYQKCPHLGCRVPDCLTSQWFECPCHGSQYNRVGEKKGGPAPRGMDRFGVTITNGNVIIDTGAVFNGPPIGTNTTGQEAEGPHCITGGH